MTLWTPTIPAQTLLMEASKAVLRAEGKNPDETLVFMDPFNWEGELTRAAGAYAADEILNRRPAWTAPRALRTAHACFSAADKLGWLRHEPEPSK